MNVNSENFEQWSTKNTKELKSEILVFDTTYLVVDRVKRKRNRVTDLLNREEIRRTSFDDYALVNEKCDV